MDEAPAFLGPEWLFNQGWAFAGEPPADLAEPRKLSSKDPWDRFLFVLASAQRGDLRHRGELAELLSRELPHPLFLAAMHLAAAIGGPQELEQLRRWIGSDWFTQAIGAVTFAASLEVVDWLLEERRRGTERCATAESAISELLEAAPDAFYDAMIPDDAYDGRARARVDELRRQHGPEARILRGAPLHPEVLIAEIAAVAGMSDDEQTEHAATLSVSLFHLETLTGVRIDGIVHETPEGERVRRARLVQLLQELERGRNPSRYPRGCRTFFGHVVDGARSRGGPR